MHNLRVYADSVNLLATHISTIKKTAEGWSRSKHKTKYTFMSLHQNAGQNHKIKIVNNPLKLFLGSVTWECQLTNKNYIHSEINSRLNLGKFLLPFNQETFIFPSPT
jgi:hypothetical protein